MSFRSVLLCLVVSILLLIFIKFMDIHYRQDFYKDYNNLFNMLGGDPPMAG